MENLHFETLEAGVNSTDKGRLGVLFHIKGEHDPKVVEKAKIGLMELLNGSAFQRRIPLPAKTPVDLTLDTSLNFDELLAAGSAGGRKRARAAVPSAPAPARAYCRPPDSAYAATATFRRGSALNPQITRELETPAMKRALILPLLAVGALAACTPTVRVKVDPINIYAKLDADVRVRLDKEVQTLIQQNPNLF
jgi:hypothetical protein